MSMDTLASGKKTAQSVVAGLQTAVTLIAAILLTACGQATETPPAGKAAGAPSAETTAPASATATRPPASGRAPTDASDAVQQAVDGFYAALTGRRPADAGPWLTGDAARELQTLVSDAGLMHPTVVITRAVGVFDDPSGSYAEVKAWEAVSSSPTLSPSTERLAMLHLVKTAAGWRIDSIERVDFGGPIPKSRLNAYTGQGILQEYLDAAVKAGSWTVKGRVSRDFMRRGGRSLPRADRLDRSVPYLLVAAGAGTSHGDIGIAREGDAYWFATRLYGRASTGARRIWVVYFKLADRRGVVVVDAAQAQPVP